MKNNKIIITLSSLLALCWLGSAAMADSTSINGNGSATPGQTDQQAAQPSDGSITTNVKDALSKDDTLSKLNLAVSTRQGTVTLSGYVDTQAELDSAVNKAKSVTGVKHVESKLTLKK